PLRPRRTIAIVCKDRKLEWRAAAASRVRRQSWSRRRTGFSTKSHGCCTTPPVSPRACGANSRHCSAVRPSAYSATLTLSSARNSRRSRRWPALRAKRTKRSSCVSRPLKRRLAEQSRQPVHRAALLREQPPGFDAASRGAAAFFFFITRAAISPPPRLQHPWRLPRLFPAYKRRRGTHIMATVNLIKAAARPRAGKGAARAERREGRVPGIIYGDGKPPLPISLDYSDLRQRIYAGHFLTTIHDVEVDGVKHRVIPRDFQLDAVRDLPLHVDFMRLGEGATIRVNIPIRIRNADQAPGVKRGGTVSIVTHTIEVR